MRCSSPSQPGLVSTKLERGNSVPLLRTGEYEATGWLVCQVLTDKNDLGPTPTNATGPPDVRALFLLNQLDSILAYKLQAFIFQHRLIASVSGEDLSGSRGRLTGRRFRLLFSWERCRHLRVRSLRSSLTMSLRRCALTSAAADRSACTISRSVAWPWFPTSATALDVRSLAEAMKSPTGAWAARRRSEEQDSAFSHAFPLVSLEDDVSIRASRRPATTFLIFSFRDVLTCLEWSSPSTRSNRP
jgi:hypothetical protein